MDLIPFKSFEMSKTVQTIDSRRSQRQRQSGLHPMPRVAECNWSAVNILLLVVFTTVPNICSPQHTSNRNCHLNFSSTTTSMPSCLPFASSVPDESLVGLTGWKCRWSANNTESTAPIGPSSSSTDRQRADVHPASDAGVYAKKRDSGSVTQPDSATGKSKETLQIWPVGS
jgi:hypothetical protein